MKAYLIGGTAGAIIALVFGLYSLKYPLGTFKEPGDGLVPLLVSSLLLVCSLGLLFRALLEAGAVDLVQPDVCKTGGLTEARAICQMAESYGVPYAPHYLGSAIGLVASLHLCASTPGFWRMELDANPNPFRSEMVGHALTVKDGCLSVPDGPGLGVEPESALIEQYRIKY